MKSYARSCAKAIVGGLVAAVGAGATAATDDVISAGEWWTIAATGLAALYAVWQTDNGDAYAARHTTDTDA